MLTKVLLGVIVLLTIGLAFEANLAHSRGLELDTAHSQAKTAADQIRALTQASHDNTTTIHACTAKLDRVSGQLQDVQAAQATAEQNAATAASERDHALAQVRNLRGQIYARDHDAAVWGAGLMPAVLSDELRRQYAAYTGDP